MVLEDKEPSTPMPRELVEALDKTLLLMPGNKTGQVKSFAEGCRDQEVKFRNVEYRDRIKKIYCICSSIPM